MDRKLAVAYVEAGQPARAAVEFERVAARETEEPEVRRAALWQAAELQQAAGDRAAATRVYTDYVRRYPVPAGPALDARQTLADLARDANDAAGRQRWLEEIIVADRAAGAERTDRTQFLAANAALELARPLDAAARSIRLALPLEKSFPAKRKALESALTAYGRAEEYGVAQVTTAAAYAMADLYRHLGRALLESDRPRGLAADELEQYDVLLEEQAFPFEEKAIGIHERNARLAAQGVYDEWVQKSYAELAQLNPGRYARVEVATPPAAVPALAPESRSRGAERVRRRAAPARPVRGGPGRVRACAGAGSEPRGRGTQPGDPAGPLSRQSHGGPAALRALPAADAGGRQGSHGMAHRTEGATRRRDAHCGGTAMSRRRMARVLLVVALCGCAGAQAAEPRAAGVPAPAAKAERAVDRLQLDATAITGTRELPKVMSIVPWKAAEPPAGPDRPLGSLIDEMLAPLDRDEFRREIRYYRDLTSPPSTESTDSTVAVPGAPSK